MRKFIPIILICFVLILFKNPDSKSESIQQPSDKPEQETVDTKEDESFYTLSDIQHMPASSVLTESMLNSELIDQLFYYTELTDTVTSRIMNISYKENDHISLSDLRYLRVLHRNIDGQVLIGELIVNHQIADDILEIMKELFWSDYPIELMVLVDEYLADDDTSMSANNSSAFNYRMVSGTNRLSNHSYGMAIDINPRYNPYIVTRNGKTMITPENGIPYADRESDFPYKIEENDLCVKLFLEHGFTWGGSWRNSKDYQHFEKEL